MYVFVELPRVWFTDQFVCCPPHSAQFASDPSFGGRRLAIAATERTDIGEGLVRYDIPFLSSSSTRL